MSLDTLFLSFLNHFQRGVMKPNRFLIKFTLPPGVNSTSDFVDGRVRVGNISQQDLKYNAVGSINIKCHTATFPMRNLQTSERNQNSSAFRVPYTQVYDPVTLSFYADADADTRRYFDIWQQAVINVRANTLNFYNEFTAPVEMWNLNTLNEPTYGVRLEEAYPIALGSLDYAYGNNEAYQTVSATLQYRRWVEIGSNADALGQNATATGQNVGANKGGNIFTNGIGDTGSGGGP